MKQPDARTTRLAVITHAMAKTLKSASSLSAICATARMCCSRFGSKSSLHPPGPHPPLTIDVCFQRVSDPNRSASASLPLVAVEIFKLLLWIASLQFGGLWKLGFIFKGLFSKAYTACLPLARSLTLIRCVISVIKKPQARHSFQYCQTPTHAPWVLIMCIHFCPCGLQAQKHTHTFLCTMSDFTGSANTEVKHFWCVGFEWIS